MLFEQVESKGLAHYSYLIGDGNDAVVIDPRRDCDVYVEKASQEGCHISHILETHRNEDYAMGSVELAARTDAEIWHADAHTSMDSRRKTVRHGKWDGLNFGPFIHPDTRPDQ